MQDPVRKAYHMLTQSSQYTYLVVVIIIIPMFYRRGNRVT